jgi:hypothetical protein
VNDTLKTMHRVDKTHGQFSSISLRDHHDTTWSVESSIVPQINNIKVNNSHNRLHGIGGQGDEERKVTFVAHRDIRNGERGFKVGETKKWFVYFRA